MQLLRTKLQTVEVSAPVGCWREWCKPPWSWSTDEINDLVHITHLIFCKHPPPLFAPGLSWFYQLATVEPWPSSLSDLGSSAGLAQLDCASECSKCFTWMVTRLQGQSVFVLGLRLHAKQLPTECLVYQCFRLRRNQAHIPRRNCPGQKAKTIISP